MVTVRALRSLLGLDEDAPNDARDTKAVRRISRELESLPAGDARFLTAFAYVLARVAHVDLEFSHTEAEKMVELVRTQGELSEAQATLVVEIAKTHQIALGGTENYLVTRQFRELSTREQRLALVRCLFAVAAAENAVSEVESSEITRIGGELGLSRQEVVAVRSEFRDQLAVLQDLPNDGS